MDTPQIDRKGIVAYLLITFAITYAIEAIIIVLGFRATDDRSTMRGRL